jgi:TatA/E family protein of Tat protein translocase
MPFGARPLDLLVILIISLLIFGPKKLPEIGAAIGKSVTAFKKGIKDATEEKETEDANLLLDHYNLDAKRLELESLEREIASKKAILNTHIVEVSSKNTDETQIS